MSDLDKSLSISSISSGESEESSEEEENERIAEASGDNDIRDSIDEGTGDEGKDEESDAKHNDDQDDNIQSVQVKRNVCMWKGERLFPPARKSLKSSKAWEFGRFLKDKTGQLRTEQTVCSLCGKVQKYRNTPTNLQQHVQAEHSEEWSGEQKTSLKETKLEHYFLTKLSQSIKKYRQDNPKQKKFNKTMTEWIVKNKRPLKIVEDPKLVEAFQIADERLLVPSSFKIKGAVKKQYDEKKAETINELKSVEWGTETSDAGSSSGGKSFIAVNFHWISEDFRMKKKLLTMLEMKESKSAVNYRKKVDEAESEFGV